MYVSILLSITIEISNVPQLRTVSSGDPEIFAPWTDTTCNNADGGTGGRISEVYAQTNSYFQQGPIAINPQMGPNLIAIE
jgi:hypothetical protein